MTTTARRPTGTVGRLLFGQPTAAHPAYRRILEGLELEQSSSLLEIGCGGGHFLAKST